MNAQNPNDVVLSPELEAEVALRAYWTEARMAAAKPLPISGLDVSLPNSDPVSTFDPVSTLELSAPLIGEPRDPGDQPLDSDPPFSTNEVMDLTVSPYRCVGKLFMVLENTDYVGSAYVIGESTIGTAGHCAYAQNWATKVLFYAGYGNGASSGSWGMKRLGTLQGWAEAESGVSRYPYDMAIGIAHRPIRPTTGKLGWIAGEAVVPGVSYTQIGYPAQPIQGSPFDGERMWETHGRCVHLIERNGTPLIIQATGNMTEGCSGGPWTVFKNGHWRVNGLNSFRYEKDPDHIYSPYFGRGFVNLIRAMEANGGDTPAAV